MKIVVVPDNNTLSCRDSVEVQVLPHGGTVVVPWTQARKIAAALNEAADKYDHDFGWLVS